MSGDTTSKSTIESSTTETCLTLKSSDRKTEPMKQFRGPRRIDVPPASGVKGVLKLNEKVGDRYWIKSGLGKGGMGEVYLAIDTVLDYPVALKILTLSKEALPEGALKRLQTEAMVTASFDHPGIVKAYDFGEHEERPYLVMEYVRGQSLEQWLKEDRRESWRVAVVGQGVAAAVGVAHRNGILHRDLKPGNVMVAVDGSVRVLDFGIAAGIPKVEILLSGPWSAGRYPDCIEIEPPPEEDRGRGTLAYMAPEQVRSEPVRLTGAVDVWALGVILWELLAGKRLFEGTRNEILTAIASDKPMPPLGDDVPTPLVEVVEACMSPAPEERPTILHLGQKLRDIAITLPRTEASGLAAFPGLIPFHGGMADRYFGRKDEVERFVTRMDKEPVLPVVGPSACGKTSFVRAGVIADLTKLENWTVLEVKADGDPWRAVAARLLQYERDGLEEEDSDDQHAIPHEASELERRYLDPLEELAKDLSNTPTHLRDRLLRIAEQERSKVLLFVDQLEHVYWNLKPADAKRFVDSLLRSAETAASPVRVILSLRDDEAWQLAEAGLAPRDEFGMEYLPQLDSADIEEIMRDSVDAADFRFADPEVATEVASKLQGRPGVLPILQITGLALWEHRDQDARAISRRTYEEVGGVLGALAQHAETVVDGLSARERDEAQVLLTRLGRSAADGVGKDALLQDQPDTASSTLRTLVDQRVVLAGRGPSARSRHYRLLHPDLPGTWERLDQWLAAAP